MEPAHRRAGRGADLPLRFHRRRHRGETDQRPDQVSKKPQLDPLTFRTKTAETHNFQLRFPAFRTKSAETWNGRRPARGYPAGTGARRRAASRNSRIARATNVTSTRIGATKPMPGTGNRSATARARQATAVSPASTRSQPGRLDATSARKNRQ